MICNSELANLPRSPVAPKGAGAYSNILIYIYIFKIMYKSYCMYSVYRKYVCVYEYSVPNMLKTLTNIGHRFGHYAGIHESSKLGVRAYTKLCETFGVLAYTK